jgi:hypothetical protein
MRRGREEYCDVCHCVLQVFEIHGALGIGNDEGRDGEFGWTFLRRSPSNVNRGMNAHVLVLTGIHF